MMPKILACLVFSFCVLALTASAQQVFTIRGIVTRKQTGDRISQVVVHNLRSNDIMMGDEQGIFTIKAMAGDTLLFEKKELGEQKVVVVNGDDLVVSMQPVIQLATVTVQGQTTKAELKDVMTGYKQDGVFNNGKSLPFWQFFNSPITGFYNLFGSDPAKARHFAAFSKQELEYDEVRRRYNLAFVKHVTGASDDEADKFMKYYLPTYDDMKTWNDYDLARQVKKRYDYWEANKARINHQDLPPLGPLPPAGGN